MLLAVFMPETLKLSKTLKSSRDDFNALDNFNVSSINASIENKFAKQMVSLSGIVATWKETITVANLRFQLSY